MTIYEHDSRGFWVMVGLTHEETEEFEQLDSKSPASGNGVDWASAGKPMTDAERRWSDLYEKHQRSVKMRKPI